MDTSQSKSLIEFPCHFPIKVMAVASAELVSMMTQLVLSFDPNFDVNTIEVRHSKQQRYTGLTLFVYVHNQNQLDDVYRALTQHPQVKMVL